MQYQHEHVATKILESPQLAWKLRIQVSVGLSGRNDIVARTGPEDCVHDAVSGEYAKPPAELVTGREGLWNQLQKVNRSGQNHAH